MVDLIPRAVQPSNPFPDVDPNTSCEGFDKLYLPLRQYRAWLFGPPPEDPELRKTSLLRLVHASPDREHHAELRHLNRLYDALLFSFGPEIALAAFKSRHLKLHSFDCCTLTIREWVRDHIDANPHLNKLGSSRTYFTLKHRDANGAHYKNKIPNWALPSERPHNHDNILKHLCEVAKPSPGKRWLLLQVRATYRIVGHESSDALATLRFAFCHARGELGEKRYYRGYRK